MLCIYVAIFCMSSNDYKLLKKSTEYNLNYAILSLFGNCLSLMLLTTWEAKGNIFSGEKLAQIAANKIKGFVNYKFYHQTNNINKI